MILISNKEFKQLEEIRQELCKNYLLNSPSTHKLWKIINIKRNFKWFINNFNK